MGTEKGQRERDVCSSLISMSDARWSWGPSECQLEKGGKQMLTRVSVTFLALATVIALSLGCNQVVTVYWSKPGAGNTELQKDKEECQALQRAVGLNEERIEKCLEAQGWSPVKQETEAATTDSESP